MEKQNWTNAQVVRTSWMRWWNWVSACWPTLWLTDAPALSRYFTVSRWLPSQAAISGVLCSSSNMSRLAPACVYTHTHTHTHTHTQHPDITKTYITGFFIFHAPLGDASASLSPSPGCTHFTCISYNFLVSYFLSIKLVNFDFVVLFCTCDLYCMSVRPGSGILLLWLCLKFLASFFLLLKVILSIWQVLLVTVQVVKPTEAMRLWFWVNTM